MLEEKLSQFGLSDKEIRVFLAIFEHKKISPSKISSMTGIKRSTVYAVAQDLYKQGFIDIDESGRVIFYFAKNTDGLQDVIKKEKRSLANKTLLLEEIGEDLSNIQTSQTYVVPKVKYIEHQENIEEYLYKRTMFWVKSMKERDKTWWGFQDHTFVEISRYRQWIEWFWKKAPLDVDLKLLSNDSKIEKEMVKSKLERREIKFWKKNFQFTSTQWVVGDYVITLMTHQKPHYLVELYNPDYAEDMRELFKSLWTDIS